MKSLASRSRALMVLALIVAALVPLASPLAPVVRAAPGTYNYAEALQKTMYFYEIQRSGNVTSANTRVAWRGPSHLNDGSADGVDLSGGWYDAGDYVKWNASMAFAGSALAWSAVDYPTGYLRGTGAQQQMSYLKGNLKWVADYFLKCFRSTDPNNPATYTIYTDVATTGRPGLADDHGYWGPPELSEYRIPDRPLWKATPSAPNAGVVAAMAAALASSSIVFRQQAANSSDTAYADTLLTAAERMFNFANTYRTSANVSNAIGPSGAPESPGGYNISGNGVPQALSWAAIWLYRAKNAQASGSGDSYLTTAESFTSSYGAGEYSAFQYGLADYVLLAKLTGKASYKTAVGNTLNGYLNATRSPGGLYQPGNDFALLRNANNAAFPMFVYSDSLPAGNSLKASYYNWAKSQVDYSLGSNPANRSYLGGFQPPGKAVVKLYHSRSVNGSWGGYENLIYTRPEYLYETSRHTFYGALIAGPNIQDEFVNDGTIISQHEVALDFNAGFTANVARLASEFDDLPLANFPPVDPRDQYEDSEYFVEAALTGSGANYIDVQAELNNRSRWPATLKNQLSFRYYFTLPAGTTITATPRYGFTGVATIQGPTQLSGQTYYFTFNFAGTPIYPNDRSAAGDFTAAWRKVVGFRLQSSAATWDPSGDWSYQGLARGLVIKNLSMPVFDNGTTKLAGYVPGDTRPAAPQPPNGAFIEASGVNAVTSQTIDLTAQGAVDWSHWSRTYSVQNHKATSGNVPVGAISDLTRIGSQMLSNQVSPASFSWSDGWAQGTDWVQSEGGTNTTTGQTDLNSGFSFTVPASTQPRTLRVFLSGKSALGTLSATLSDGSAPPFTITFGNLGVYSGEGMFHRMVTLTYRAATNNQQLTVQWLKTDETAGTFSYVAIAAATLNDGYTPTPSVLTRKPDRPSVTSVNNGTSVRLTWTPAPQALFYNIYRSTSSSGPFLPIKAVGPVVASSGSDNFVSLNHLDQGSFTDVNVSPPAGGKYYYVVAAANYFGESDRSNIVDSTGTQAANAPTVATPAAANPSLVTGTSTSLSVLGASPVVAESQLTYTWSAVSKPASAASPTFSPNGSNAAKNSTATFTQAGSYTLRATISDPQGRTTFSDVIVVVNQTPATISLSPANPTVPQYTTQQFSVSGTDQFGQPLSAGLTYSWSVVSGGGTIDQNGLYVAPGTTGSATVRAASGSVAATTNVSIVTNTNANLALKKFATASSVQTNPAPSVSVAPGNAVDGNTQTRWSSAFSDPQWLQVDLGTSQTINRVIITWEDAYGKGYDVQVANSASGPWTTLYSTTTGDGGVDDLTGLNGSGRYLRVYGTIRGINSGGCCGYSIYELEAYGTGGPPPSGSLSGSLGAAATSVNLASEGTTDWAHWGLVDANSFNHKNGATTQIGSITKIGSGDQNRFDDNNVSYSWTGGTPTASATNTTTGIWTNGSGNGFQFTVPADTTQRTLKVYVGLWRARGKLEATLSDGSAPAYINTGLSNSSDTSNGVYTITYKAASAGQTLTIKYTVDQAFDAQWGNVTLQAATLQR